MEDAIARSLHRAALYRLAAGAFSYPEPGLLAELRSCATRCLDSRGAAGDPLTAAVAGFRAALREPDAVASILQQEYVFLFDRQVHCSPYETAYGDGRRIAGKSAELADIAGFYTAFGLAPSAARPDMVDHVAAELEFMSLLALKEAAALTEDLDEALAVTREAARAFLRDHLGRWAGAFARQLADSTAVPYYQAAGRLLAALVDEEVRALGVEPKPAVGLAAADPMQEEQFTCPFGDACDAGGEAAPDPAAPAGWPAG